MKRLLILTAVASAVFGGYSSAALAQTAATGARADLRPLFATPMDIADGKQLAGMTCARCHNARRHRQQAGHPPYRRPAAGLSLFGARSLQVGRAQSRQGARRRQVSERRRAGQGGGLLRRARPRAGRAGAGRLCQARSRCRPARPRRQPASAVTATPASRQIPGTPSLAGLDPKYLIEAMKDYKNGKRQNATMKAMLAAVNDKAMADIALFFALQKPARAKTPAAGDKAAGKAAAASCSGCHGEDGVSTSPATPEPGRTRRRLYRGGAARLQERKARPRDHERHGRRAQRRRDEESRGLLRGAATEGAERA